MMMMMMILTVMMLLIIIINTCSRCGYSQCPDRLLRLIVKGTVMTMTMVIVDACNDGANENDYQHIVKNEVFSENNLAVHIT